jgi:hypothetical protein
MLLHAEWTPYIKRRAAELGFMACGISKAEFLEDEAPRLENWLKKGMHGKMAWMENHFDKRLDPRLLVDGAKSVISLLLNYYPPEEAQQPNDTLKISKYAYGRDYHFVIKDKLKTLLADMQANIGEVGGRLGPGARQGLGQEGRPRMGRQKHQHHLSQSWLFFLHRRADRGCRTRIRRSYSRLLRYLHQVP